MKTIYAYAAAARRSIDGDTVVLTARQQLRWPDEAITCERDFVVRLLAVDAPERRGDTKAAGDAALTYVRSVLFADGDPAEPIPLELETDGAKDVYGRTLGRVRITKGPHIGRDLSELIVEAGHGVAKDYAAHRAELMGAP